MAEVVCVDCKAEGQTRSRKVKLDRRGKPVPGKRCATHWRTRRTRNRDYSHERHIMDTYGITSEEYWAIHAHQGGVCYICRRANGSKKRLSVDHCHKTGLVRGLLCTMCNKYILGHARDDTEFFYRAIDYLNRPPAFGVIGRRVTPDMIGVET